MTKIIWNIFRAVLKVTLLVLFCLYLYMATKAKGGGDIDLATYYVLMSFLFAYLSEHMA